MSRGVGSRVAVTRAWDEALATGTPPEPPPSLLPAEQAQRLSRLQNCLRRLHAVHSGSTPHYLAPEQVRATGSGSDRANAIGSAADVYALGSSLYELLTGRPPFVGGSDLEAQRQVREDEPIAPRRLRSGVPRDLQAICLKCLEKEPRRRYADAMTLADDLRWFREGQPIQAQPPRWYTRVWKWACRRPALAGLLVGSVLTLVGLGVGVVLYFRTLDQALFEFLDGVLKR